MKFMKIRGLAVCFWGPSTPGKSIHQQIEETIAERKRILPEWEKLFLEKDSPKDIHAQLKETIAGFKQAMKQHENFFSPNHKKAA